MRKHSTSSPLTVDHAAYQSTTGGNAVPYTDYYSPQYYIDDDATPHGAVARTKRKTTSVSITETPSLPSGSGDGMGDEPIVFSAAHVLTDMPAKSPLAAEAADATKERRELNPLSNPRKLSVDAETLWSSEYIELNSASSLQADVACTFVSENSLAELALHRKTWSVVKVLLKLLVAIGCLYVFICALSLMADSLRMLAGRQTNSLFSNGLLRNPVVGLMIGLLVTVVLHSSATATSITIAMSAAGVLPVENAIYIVMGANIGTTVTSSCVSLIQIGDREEFQRAFAGASLGSVFNWLSVLIFLPLEVATGFLRWVSGHIVAAMALQTDKGADRAYLKKLTEPVTRSILQLNKTMMNELSESTDPNLYANESVLRHNATYLFAKTSLSDTQIGIITGLISLAALCFGLVCLVQALHSLLGGKLAVIVKRVVNAELPGPLRYFTGYLFIAFSVVAAILIQSSSIFTSTLTPLVGVGIVSLERMYTFTLGSDLGTTLTGVLAALATDANQINVAMQVAMAHLVFNALGIVLFYPVPFMRWPIFMASWMGRMTAQYRWFPIFYITLLYFILPAIVIGLSLAGTVPLLIVCIPVLLLFVFVVLVNFLQNHRPAFLPANLRSWNFLPEFMRSFGPYDRAMMKMACYKKLAACSAKKNNKKPNKQKKKHKTDMNEEVPPVDSTQFADVRLTTTYAGKEDLQMGISSSTLA